VRIIAMPSARGYWGATYRMDGTVILTGSVKTGAASWMSIVPMEVESQEIGIAAARGHTVVLGLGMGWCAANVALNPAVDRVTVVERDPEVIALIDALGVVDQLPRDIATKIRIVQGDALEWRPDSPVDSVQADIWAKFVEPQKWDDVRRMQDNIGAASLYFWGQEMELWRLACRDLGGVPKGPGHDHPPDRHHEPAFGLPRLARLWHTHRHRRAVVDAETGWLVERLPDQPSLTRSISAPTALSFSSSRSYPRSR